MTTMTGCGSISSETEKPEATQQATTGVDISKAEITIKVSNGASESSPGVQAQISTFKTMVEEKSPLHAFYEK